MDVKAITNIVPTAWVLSERMETNMDQRSEAIGEELLYRGILPVAMSGRLVRCHFWEDGTSLPVLAGFDGEDDDADEDSGDDDNDADGTDDDEDGDDDDEDDPDKIKDVKRRKSAQQAARYRVQRNEARAARDAAKAKITELEGKLADAVKNGAGDETLKAKVTELETQLAEKGTKLSELESKLKGAGVTVQVAEAVKALKIKDNVDYVVWLLGKEGLDETDEADGKIEELDKHLKRLVKSKALSVRGDEDDDDETDDDANRTSGRSSGRTMNGKRKSKRNLDRATLESKYPALRRG